MNSVSRTALTIATLHLMSSCTGSSGNLYFFSVQRIGVEIAASDPTSNAAPKVVLGYESLKGAIDPVKNDNGTLRDEAYSVLGITNAAATGSSSSGITVAEWFATGHAADLLAENPMTPAALTGSVTLTPEVLARASERQVAMTVDAIVSAVNWINADPAKTDSDKRLVSALDPFAASIEPLQFAAFNSNGTRGDNKPAEGPRNWERLIMSRADLQTSISNAKARSIATTGVEPDAKQQAADAAAALQALLNQLDHRILESPAPKAIWRRLTDIVKQGGQR